ncbi:MAG: hypothetical protein M0025_04295 [Elusimicrobia bacterium]|nr:hypothetical protein [Elusimicrobiota bacterium]
MKLVTFFLSAALAASAAALLPDAVRAGGGCSSLAGELGDAAADSGMKRIAVLGFAAKAGAGGEEGDFISERIAAELARRGEPALIERSQLAAVLKEARSSAETPGDLDGIFSVDGVVTGSVFASGDKLKVLAKLINVRTGQVMAAGMAEEDRDWPRLPEAPLEDLAWDPLPWPASMPGLKDAPAAPAFRDAPASFTSTSCEARKKKLRELNSKLTDEKARYWAAKMREPGFSIGKLTRNPGSEIADPADRARFYGLLGSYFRQEAPPEPSPHLQPELKALLAEEAAVYDECGSR